MAQTPGRDAYGHRQFDMSAAPPPSASFTVKKKRLPAWATPGLVVGVSLTVVVLALAIVALSVDTDSRHLLPMLLLLALSIPALSVTGYRLLNGAPKTQSLGGVRVGNGILGQLFLIRFFVGGWVGFAAGIGEYLRYIKVF